MLDTYNDNNFNSNNPDNFPEEDYLDYSLIDNIVFGGIDPEDHPHYCDAYIESADYNGRELTEAELEVINLDISYWHMDIVEAAF
jgi:hypothetical protein